MKGQLDPHTALASAPLAGHRTHPLMFGDAFPQVVRALDCCAQSSDSGRLLPLPTAGNFAEENTMSHPGAEASAAKAPKAPATSVVRGIIDERCESNARVGYKAPATNVVQGNIDEYRVLSAGVAYAEPTTRREDDTQR